MVSVLVATIKHVGSGSFFVTGWDLNNRLSAQHDRGPLVRCFNHFEAGTNMSPSHLDANLSEVTVKFLHSNFLKCIMQNERHRISTDFCGGRILVIVSIPLPMKGQPKSDVGSVE